ncbi:FAD/NAD(P)-binding protein [Patulibacter minatonensis]|uniref:FAD/NAD(P)-binding protein n=1 Tax=Patulibacter minatonensis TaxID=298163 RepID=UPI00047ADA4B|nr:FAD/NAD(P)-binding protein [Patulibacter minatonensis]
MSEATPLRVAIVGLGPKGLFALERLLEHAAGPLEVDVFEPHRAPGAGPVYDPHQPSWLLMNNAAEHVDLWWPGGTRVPVEERRPFVAWNAGGPGGRGSFVPRAAVGAYLEDGLRTVLAHAPDGVVVRVHPVRVREVRRTATGWHVDTGAATAEADHDEVLLATGHARGPDPLLEASWSGPARLVPGVFPVERRLTPSVVPPGSTVGIRGFALTAIDAILALTEGRGGSFLPDARPGRLRYVPPAPDRTAGPPRSIVPFSRTGEPMHPKPATGLHDGEPGLDQDVEAAVERIRALPGRDAATVRALAAEVAAVAAAALDAIGGPADDEAHAPRAWTDAVLDGRLPDASDPAAVLGRALDVAVGVRPAGTAWALGHAWRTLYPAIAGRCAGDALDDDGWATFRALAVAFERIAFGPAPVNVAKLLALAEAGVLDLRHARGTIDHVAADDGPIVAVGTARGMDPSSGAASSDPPAVPRTVVRSAAGEQPVDVVVDAVLAPPGVPAHADGPAARLIAGHHARLLAGRRGLDVLPDGTCRAADGTPSSGLAAVGRPTEDAEIGHDTLSRTLHAQTDRWARRVAARATASHPTTTSEVTA